MTFQIIPIGGYSEIGRNCTLVVVDDEAVILDLGLHMDNYISYTEEREDLSKKGLSSQSLIKANAVPNINKIKDWWPKVKAICVSHAHLDHVGAIPFLGNKFKNAEIHATDYTIAVLSTILSDEKIELKNKLVRHPVDSTFKVSNKITVEFVNITHSIPQTVVIVVHTPYGKVVYANDFKLDNNPTLGDKPNTKRLKEIGEEGVDVFIVNALYAHKDSKTPSESIAREMLKDVMLGVESKGKAMIVTTFSSHIARLRSIVALGHKLKRRVVFVGRSLSKYISAAEKAGLVNFDGYAEFVRYGDKTKKFFKNLAHPEKYLLIVTGHQGEPKAVLSRMVYQDMFKFAEEDEVIFSCTIIPVLTNKLNREKLDAELKRKKVRLFNDVHVSGHASREDHRDIINMLKPKTIIPVHAEVSNLKKMRELAEEMGYNPKRVKILTNGNVFSVN